MLKNNNIHSKVLQNRSKAAILGVFALSVMLSLSFFGCKKDEVALPTLLVNPSDLIQTVEPASFTTFTTNLEAEGGLSRFVITESINGESASTIFDTSLTGLNIADVVYTYQMPESKQQGDVLLVFKVYDELNNVGSAARNLMVAGLDSLLNETAGLSLYTYKSGKRNGFFINDDSLVYSNSVFFDDLDLVCSDTTDTLSGRILSPIGNEFVPFNGFNYDSATYRNMTDAFDFGNPVTTLTNVQTGNIYITKLITPTLYDYALIKITNVIDDTGSDNDRYVFSIKK